MFCLLGELFSGTEIQEHSGSEIRTGIFDAGTGISFHCWNSALLQFHNNRAANRCSEAKECIIMDKVLIYFRAELIKSSLMHGICIKITF